MTVSTPAHRLAQQVRIRELAQVPHRYLDFDPSRAEPTRLPDQASHVFPGVKQPFEQP